MMSECRNVGRSLLRICSSVLCVVLALVGYVEWRNSTLLSKAESGFRARLVRAVDEANVRDILGQPYKTMTAERAVEAAKSFEHSPEDIEHIRRYPASVVYADMNTVLFVHLDSEGKYRDITCLRN